jgi:hypothetical protein
MEDIVAKMLAIRQMHSNTPFETYREYATVSKGALLCIR